MDERRNEPRDTTAFATTRRLMQRLCSETRAELTDPAGVEMVRTAVALVRREHVTLEKALPPTHPEELRHAVAILTVLEGADRTLRAQDIVELESVVFNALHVEPLSSGRHGWGGSAGYAT
jgi:hypothetical protein